MPSAQIIELRRFRCSKAGAVPAVQKSNITPMIIRSVCFIAAERLSTPALCVRNRMATNDVGEPACVYTTATRRDPYGWVIKVAYDQLRHEANSPSLAEYVAQVIDSQLRINGGDEIGLARLNEFRPAYAAQMLREAGHAIRQRLPKLYPYAKSPRKTDAEKRARLAKRAKQQ